MRRPIILAATLAMALLAPAQDASLTHVVVRMALDGAGAAFQTTVTYFDGLGRLAWVEYGWDGGGRMLWDRNRGVASIEYDAHGGMRRMQKTDGCVTEHHRAGGVKIKAVRRTAVPNVTVPMGRQVALTPATTLQADSTTYLGSLLLHDGTPWMLHFPGGFCTFEGDDLDAVPHYVTADHQGSVRVVAARDGTVEQVTNYYPFGLPYSDGTSTNTAMQPLKYIFSIEREKRKLACSSEREKKRQKVNGKELDMTHGWNTYDYGARLYDPALCRWTTMDPVSEMYHDVNPYAYCSDDPVNKVDPNGLDEWEINSQGQIKKRITTKEHDAFFIVNDNGERVEGKGIFFNYGFISKSFKSHTKEKVIENGKTKEIKRNFDVYVLRGDANSKKLYEFLTENTSVEWSKMSFGVEGNRGLNVLTTSHKEDIEYGATSMLSKQYLFDYTIREHIHSHPHNIPFPSGFGEYYGTGDMEFARQLQGIRPSVRLFIYLPGTKKYVGYNKDSTIDDF